MSGSTAITQITIDTPGAPLPGQVVTFSVGADQPLTLSGGAPTLTLNNGGAVAYTGLNSAGQLQFSYTIPPGAVASDLQVTAFAANGASITNADAGGIAFGGPTTIAAPLRYGAITTADLTGDGRQDVIVTDRTGNQVEVFANTGGALAAPVAYAVGAVPDAVYAADLNGDGKPDLVTANANSNNVSVLLNNGDGGFANQTNFAVGASPVSLAVADVNGDGAPDLVTVGNVSNAPVSVLLNDGHGGFGAFTRYDTGGETSAVAAGDLNGDGLPDIVVFGEGVASVLINNGGGFATPQNYATGNGWLPGVLIDVNGDGRLDLVKGDGATNAADVLLNNGAGGLGASTLEGDDASASGFGGTASIPAADLMGDGGTEFLLTSTISDKISVLRNNGGALSALSPIPAGESDANIAVADVNGDGKPDILLSSGDGLTTLLNQSAPPELSLTFNNVPTSAAIGSATDQAYVQRIYAGLFDRAGDAPGLFDWNNVLGVGASLTDVAAGFLNSAEYAAAHGALSDGAFVQSLYSGFLGRDASETELAFWTGALAQPGDAASLRAQILADIASAPEAGTALTNDTANHLTGAHDALLKSLYQAGLNRTPESEALSFWAGGLQSGLTISDLAAQISASPEFQQLHAAQTSTQFVASLYQNASGAAPDSATLQSYASGLDMNTLAQADVLLAVSRSAV